jgi:aspartate 1-decarboxylase
MPEEEAREYKPIIVHVDKNNAIVKDLDEVLFS